MDAGELLDRYVSAVGRELPKPGRADFEAELRSLLDDALAERAEAAGRAPDEALAVALLTDFGPPDRVAERYGQPRRCLVGPVHYPAYRLTLLVVAAVLGALFLFGAFWSLALGESDPQARLLGLASMTFQFGWTLLANVGLVTLVFAGVERWDPADALAGGSTWDPRALPAVADPDRLDRGDLAVEMGIDAALLVFLNLAASRQSPLPLLPAEGVLRFTPAFLDLMPWLNGLLLLSLGLNAVVLRQGRWRPATRLASVALGVYALWLIARLLTGGDLVSQGGLSQLLKLGFAFLGVLVVVDIAQQAARLVQGPRPVAAAQPASPIDH
jgi:hypothetical protein